MIDEALFAKQIQRERRRRFRDGAVLFAIVTAVCYLVAFVLLKAFDMHPQHRVLVALMAAPPIAAAGAVVLWLVLSTTGKVTDAMLHPGGSGMGPVPTSQAEYFFRTGDLAESMKSFDALRETHGDTVELLRIEADLHLRRGGDPQRARDLLIRLRQAADVSRADELHASQRLIDLYFGPLKDEGRALVEMRRLVDRFPGTRDAEGARAELERRKERDRR